MATTIKLKNGSGAPAASDLVQGEPALDLTNNRLYSENGSGSVVEIGTNPTSLSINGTAITSTAAELNILDGVTSTAAELNILDGVTSTTAELNILDGVTSTTAELNILDGVTSTTAELNLVDGSSAGTIVNSKSVIYGSSGEVNATTLQIAGSSITSTAAELNLLDGVTSTTAELNILDGVTSTAGEINLLDGSTAGTVVNSKAVIYGSSGEVKGTTFQTATNTSGNLLIANGTGFASTAVGDLSEISTVADDDVLIAVDTSGGGLKKLTKSTLVAGLSASSGISNVVEDTTPQLGGSLDVNGQDIVSVSNGNITLTPNGTGLVRLDGNVDIQTGEIVLKNGGTASNIKFYCESSNAHYTQLQSAAHADYSGNVTLTLPPSTDTLVGRATTDTLTNKRLTSPKLNEDVAVSATATELNVLDGITSTTAELNILDGVTSTASELNLVDGSSAGTIVNSKAVVYGSSGEVNATTLQIAGTSITSTAAELNILDGVTSTTAELNILDGVTSTAAELNYLDITTLGTSEASKAVTADSGAKVKFIGTTSVAEMIEKVTTQTSTTGTINFDFLTQAVEFYTANQTANRTINFRGDGSTALNAVMAVGESMTAAILMTQGSSAYYLNTYQIDGSSVTPEWSGGSAPSSGNASSIDSYVFTIIKTADATFTVLASQTQFA